MTQDLKSIVDELADLAYDERAAWFDEHPQPDSVRERIERVLADVDRVIADAEALPDVVAPARADVIEGDMPEMIGPYRVIDRLGAGGMGVVYLAEQVDPQRRVAVKVLRGGALDDEIAQRFAREAELLGRLQHAGIAQVIELGRLESGEAYLVLEAIDGSPISTYASDNHLDQRQRIEMLVALADAVHHAHLRSVIHRDLKPSNVLVTGEGQVKVIDFGVARALDQRDTLLTREGQLIGTLAYMSPEQIEGDSTSVDARADIYALGVIAYELLGGRLPLDVDSKSVAHAARVITENTPTPLGRIVPECRGDLEVIIGKALEKDPDDRYASAAEFGADLQRTLRHEAILARRPTLRYQLGKLARRHRGAFTSAALAVVSLVIATGVALRYAHINSELAASETEAREDAEHLKNLAEQRAAEVIRRADPARLLLARKEADELWPALPATVPAMDAWLARYVDTFTENIVAHTAALEELRSEVLPYDDEQHRRDREQHPLNAELAESLAATERLQARLAGDDPATGVLTGDLRASQERSLDDYRERAAKIEAALAGRLSWTFADAVVQEEHDHLAGLVTEMRAFLERDDGLAAVVLRRRERAERIEERTVTNPDVASAWQRARDDIAALDTYGDLDLAPQVGLVPLRRDAHSGLWEFWHVESGERPVEGDDGTWELTAETGLVLVLLPGGSTTVGAQPHDAAAPHFDSLARPFESPVRDVELPPFFVSKYEMTQEQFYRQTGERPSQYGYFAWFGVPPRDEPISLGTDWNPVETVSLVGCEGLLWKIGLRVPSGDEWEHAARGGTSTRWWTGDDVASLQGAANVADGRTRTLGGPREWTYDNELADDWITHAPVGTFAPNPFGLHDVIGNVYEWTSDEPEPGIAVARGGAYEHPAVAGRVTAREHGEREGRSRFVGVRPVRDLDGP